MTRYNSSRAGGMVFASAQQFQMGDPEKYRYKRAQAITNGWRNERGNKIRKIKDTWWFVNSTSSTTTNYLLHVHEDATFYLEEEKPMKSTGNRIPIRGRIECECKSFIYSKFKPRCCKHSIELARRFFGEKSLQYLSLVNAREHTLTSNHSGDEWCNHLAKIENIEYYEGQIKKGVKAVPKSTLERYEKELGQAREEVRVMK